ncbi:hypothetical protein LOZ12_002535 [Ophidiomyces ophidiicola]|uniref:Uncharacterized protein n=1 Tax=Ophidiomyces ophidiicola TaxID=1387563 RepID=A0ACB8UZC3_9EURO|nr:hypothetical protein LOZ62_003123 [Ophidiomyces ophidiicola]KAI1971999.1 hypothetical protein LOZ56_002687 [Ophidiomyces ophidiicola]KAI2005298.1 hypothetical protein LOZ50_003788 [Ophidiomyces ophidiicola]KAI2017389.1 hypothetical protein LOZ46_004471 [Ophidiomyces ophidiicola]KAI2025341.1 hypothetical protein LOZ45_003406 [Ophidiomyces ophidiicola]
MIAIEPPYTASSSPHDGGFPSLSNSPRKTTSRKSTGSPFSTEVLLNTGTSDTVDTESMNEMGSLLDLIPPSTEKGTSPPSLDTLPVNGNVLRAENGLQQATPQELTLQTTDLQSNNPSAGEDNPQSVIHAPPGFAEFRAGDSPQESTMSSAHDSDVTVRTLRPSDRTHSRVTSSPVSPPPLTTKVAPWSDRTTPRAQTRQEVDAFGRRSRPNSLEDIPENFDHDSTQMSTDDEPERPNELVKGFHGFSYETDALNTALSECWTLCNTLAILSSTHREHLFKGLSKGNMQEQAWKTCWKLCRNLYENRNSSHSFQARPTLDLCREFCQALFEIRVRDNDTADSILRVSFELNNHLYNTHDHNLPEAFRERTLDFYITLCHRLMKQRTQLAEEPDSLLKACWSLAEMLFSLRQSRREDKSADEELLGSAVQACWDLCDLFREGWTQVRPDRRTPRPSQQTFTQAFYEARGAQYSKPTEISRPTPNPETPTTIFDDTATTLSPDQVQVPNILVLGAGNIQSLHPQWVPTSSSTLTGYSRPSSRSSTTSSTHTVKSPADDPNLTCLKLLIVRAAMNNGFQHGGAHTLPSFVKALSSDAFGSLPWQTCLLRNYKNLVTVDPAFNGSPISARATAPDIARAVQAMIQHSGQYTWLLDLYRLVFGFRTEEAIHGSSVTIQT